ncbi:MAG TPA: hypothetical protein VJ717_20560, partial [Gemmatimonadaceae bacterium]|nr:hypothetical protein [Gemmatimonadaceae bacterium]
AWRSAHEGVAWSIESQTNVVGSSRQDQTLRFAQRGQEAPKVDLADYLITLRAGRARLSLGHVNAGTNRHLMNGFGSRGVTLATDMGPTTVTLSALNGSSIVGWNNPLGLAEERHRVTAAALGTELIRQRPGALRVELSLLDGSLLPQTSFTQGAVVDAEESRGAGLQVSASTPDQRMRFTVGYARSRFTNPARDPQLLGDTAVRPVRPETRSSQFVEVGVGLLQNAQVRLLGATSLNAAYRHERIDPLYRSVAASTQADLQQNAFELNGNVGLLSAQLTHARSHDNLDEVLSVLRTLSRQTAASVALPLTSVARLRRVAKWLPALGYSMGHTHQFAAGTPTNGDFRPTDLPDQVSLTHNADAQWQPAGALRATYRFSSSDQDNRQPTRELADFAARTHAMTLAIALGACEVSVEASSERQLAKERGEKSNVRRLGLGVTWRPWHATSIIALMNTVNAHDASRPTGSRNNEARFEVSQGLMPSGGVSRGQLFLRYALTAARVPFADAVPAELAWQRQWTLSSGVSLRLF